MKYDTFFRAFYIEGNDGCLKGCNTTSSIPRYFVESIIKDEEGRKKLPLDDTSYDKWFHGTSSPRNHWANLAKNYKEDLLVADLMDAIDESNIKKLLLKFDIEDDNEVNKLLLCTAIAQQFKEIIDGKGEGKDVVTDIYASGNIKAEFTDYIDKAIARYNRMKLIGGEEVPLEEFFVSNTIGEKERVFADKKRINCAYLDNPSLDSIRNIYLARRGYDNLKTKLIGSGGSGKTLMLQHLFLMAAKSYKKTGILPIFLELRYFTQSDTVSSFIVKTVSDKDSKFNEDVARKLFLSGRCQLLLDGFDEIDPSDVDDFIKKLNQFTDCYDKVQIVISSRENDSLSGLFNYVTLYMWPFDTSQSNLLIDKILLYKNETNNRDTVLEYINNGFLKKDGIFATNPLLLTFVTIKYPIYKRFGDNHLLFYKSAYEALLSGHDDNKKPYDRVFMSVDDPNQFSVVFKEFCALSFADGVLEFDSSQFDLYFERLSSYKNFKNPYKMTITNFKHDVCSTACMMYEKECDIYYIDPGFQEYLFAEYYASADLEEMKNLLKSLKVLPYSRISRFEAFDMLNKLAQDKIRFYLLLPFLDNIFKGSEEESFIRFLETCFEQINICVKNEALQLKVAIEKADGLVNTIPSENHPSTILLEYILKTINEDYEYNFPLYSNLSNIDKFKIFETGKLLGDIKEIEKERVLLVQSVPIEQCELIEKKYRHGNNISWFTENDTIIYFGSKLTIDTFNLFENPEDFNDLILDVIKESPETYSVFLNIKNFYIDLKKKKHRREG